MSALTGEGVDAWLEFVAQRGPAGQYAVDVDYDTYASGEAVLGWLNAAVALHARGPVDWQAFAEDLLAEIRRALAACRAEIAHIKLIIGTGEKSLTGNVTSNAGPAFIGGSLSPAMSQSTMRINARVHIGPDELRMIVEGALRVAAGQQIDATITSIRSFRPGRPVPTHRFAI
jgi:hypothetical protein